jgi:hypothetical protein
LRRLAKEYNCVVIFGCQTNRAEGGAGDKALTMNSALGFSIENAADIVIGISRPNKKAEEENNAKKYEVMLQIIKSKSSQSGWSETLIFTPSKGTFEEVGSKNEDLMFNYEFDDTVLFKRRIKVDKSVEESYNKNRYQNVEEI